MKMDFILSETDNGAMMNALSLLAKTAFENKTETFIALVPETKTLLAERFLLENSKNHAFANIYIYSFGVRDFLYLLTCFNHPTNYRLV